MDGRSRLYSQGLWANPRTDCSLAVEECAQASVVLDFPKTTDIRIVHLVEMKRVFGRNASTIFSPSRSRGANRGVTHTPSADIANFAYVTCKMQCWKTEEHRAGPCIARCTPRQKRAVSRDLQVIGRYYTHYRCFTCILNSKWLNAEEQ